MRRYHDEDGEYLRTTTPTCSKCSSSKARKRVCPGRPSSTSGTTTGVPSAASSHHQVAGLRRGESRRSVGRPRHRARPAQGPGRGEERAGLCKPSARRRAGCDTYLWNWVDGNRVVNRPRKMSDAYGTDRALRPNGQGPEAEGVRVRWARPSSTPSSSRWAWSTTAWSPAPASDRPHRAVALGATALPGAVGCLRPRCAGARCTASRSRCRAGVLSHPGDAGHHPRRPGQAQGFIGGPEAAQPRRRSSCGAAL